MLLRLVSLPMPAISVALCWIVAGRWAVSRGFRHHIEHWDFYHQNIRRQPYSLSSAIGSPYGTGPLHVCILDKATDKGLWYPRLS